MNVLVAYGSRLGSTRGIADRIAARLGVREIEATARDLRSQIDPSPYDAFVIGSAVYAGHWMKTVGSFVHEHRAFLAACPVWLFSSGPVGRLATDGTPGAPAEVARLQTAIRAREHRVFAGALDRTMIDQGGFGAAERFIAKRFVPEGDFRDWSQIDAWADSIARELAATPVVAG